MLGLCALIVAVAMVSIGVTLALDPITAFETNVVVIGNINIKLNDEYVGNDMDTPPVFNPGQTVDKKVSVTNTGDNPCYVRVLVNTSWEETTTVGGETYQIYYYKDIVYKDIVPSSGTEAQRTTKPLFENFSIKNYSNEIDKVGGTNGSIKVMAQAVQSDNVNWTPAGMGGTVEKAQVLGWSDDDDAVYVVKWNNLIFN